MAISLVTSQIGTGNNSATANITVSGTNKIVVAAGFTCINTSGDPGATVTFDGASPTVTIFSTFNGIYHRSFMSYWLNPISGSANAIVTGTDCKALIVAACFSGVDQTNPIGTLKTGNAMALTGIACNANDTIFDLLVADGDAVVATKDALYTLVQQGYLAASAGYGNGNTSYKALATSTSESVTWTGSVGNVILHNAIPIHPVGLGLLTPIWFD